VDYTQRVIFFHSLTIGLITYFLFVGQVQDPVELIPVDAGIEDRNTLSESFKLQQNDLRIDTSFEKLYRVKGNDGIFVRRSGGLHAVFRNPEYIDTTDGSIPIVPAGTIYCIGRVSSELLDQLSGLSTTCGLHTNGSSKTDEPKTDEPKIRWTPPQKQTSTSAIKRTIKFIDDEEYRRQRLTSFVLELVLSN
jgi:hypothetical protein